LAARRTRLGDSHPDTHNSKNDLANAYIAAQRFNDGIRLYKENLAVAPENTIATNNLGYAYEASNQLDDAVRWHEETLKLHRKNSGRFEEPTLTTIRNLTRLYGKMNRLDDLERLFKESLSDRLFCVALSNAKYLGPAAIAELLAAAVADDGRPTPRAIDTLTLAELRILADKPESAEPIIRAAIQQGEGQVYFYKSLGWCLLAQGKTREMKEAFAHSLGNRLHKDGSVDLDKAEPDVVISAFLFDRLSEEQFTSKFVETKYPACMPWFYIGQRREMAGNKQGAIEAYKRCAELDPADESEVLSALAKWRLERLTNSTMHDQK
jgi:tetratricopeptide (TPR) repeat protein